MKSNQLDLPTNVTNMFLSLQILLLTLSHMVSKGPYTQGGFCMHDLCPLVAWRSAGEVRAHRAKGAHSIHLLRPISVLSQV